MTIRRILLKLAAASAVVGLTTSIHAQEPVPVVATFSILGDMVERVGGDAVNVTTLVGRNGDTHVYQPTPADAKAVKRATLMFTNGLEFEGWLERLAEAAEFEGLTVVTTNGLELIALEEHHDEEHEDDEHAKTDTDEHHDEASKDKYNADEHNEEDRHHDHGEFDPHGWLSLQNAIIYIDNITAALAKTAPQSASMFYQNRADYVAEIELLDLEINCLLYTSPSPRDS